MRVSSSSTADTCRRSSAPGRRTRRSASSSTRPTPRRLPHPGRAGPARGSPGPARRRYHHPGARGWFVRAWDRLPAANRGSTSAVGAARQAGRVSRARGGGASRGAGRRAGRHEPSAHRSSRDARVRWRRRPASGTRPRELHGERRRAHRCPGRHRLGRALGTSLVFATDIEEQPLLRWVTENPCEHHREQMAAISPRRSPSGIRPTAACCASCRYGRDG